MQQSERPSDRSGFPSPDELFDPAWNSIELFGPPGAGKSYYCRRVSACSNVLTTCDDGAVWHYAHRDLPIVTRLARSVLGSRVTKNYSRWYLRRESRRFWKGVGASKNRYLESVERLISLSGVSAGTIKNVRNSVRDSGILLARALRDNEQILVDEGLLRKLQMILARTGGNGDGPAILTQIQECLNLYPWEKNGLLVDASEETCMERQVTRELIIFGPDKPQGSYHSAGKKLAEMAQAAGWTIASWKNG